MMQHMMNTLHPILLIVTNNDRPDQLHHLLFRSTPVAKRHRIWIDKKGIRLILMLCFRIIKNGAVGS